MNRSLLAGEGGREGIITMPITLLYRIRRWPEMANRALLDIDLAQQGIAQARVDGRSILG
jgi:hypothetical protein